MSDFVRLSKILSVYTFAIKASNTMIQLPNTERRNCAKQVQDIATFMDGKFLHTCTTAQRIFRFTIAYYIMISCINRINV